MTNGARSGPYRLTAEAGDVLIDRRERWGRPHRQALREGGGEAVSFHRRDSPAAGTEDDA